jgi:hypothetical protein
MSSYIFRFEWLRDLKATGDISARRLSRRLVEYWIEKKPYKKHARKVKKDRKFVLATRISSMIMQYDFFCSSANDLFRKLFFRNLRREYCSLRAELPHKGNNFEKLSMLKAALEYNVYCEFDSALFYLLLRDVAYIICQLPETLLDIPVNQLFREFCIVIGIRNALTKWESSYLNNIPYRRNLYVQVFSDIQRCLSRMAEILRFFRHNSGELSSVNFLVSSSCLYEPISSANIDIALSQAEISEQPQQSMSKNVVKFANKQSTLFINLKKRLPVTHKINGYCENCMKNVMNIEWSAQSYYIVTWSSVALHRIPQRFFQQVQERDTSCHSEKTFGEVFTFHGESSDGATYVFERTLNLGRKLDDSTSVWSEGDVIYENLLDCKDVFIADADSLVVMQFGIGQNFEVSIIEQSCNLCTILLSAKSLHDERSKKLRQGNKKRSFLFEFNSNSKFDAKLSKRASCSVITLIYSLIETIQSDVRWAFRPYN